jgi:hypothetical protein
VAGPALSLHLAAPDGRCARSPVDRLDTVPACRNRVGDQGDHRQGRRSGLDRAGRAYDVDAHARDDVDARLLPVAALTELGRTAPDLMLALLGRLVAGAFDSIDWMTRALISAG